MADEEHEPSPRKRGRPRVAAPLSTVSTRLPPDEHDLLIKRAQQKDMTVAEYMRHVLRQK